MKLTPQTLYRFAEVIQTFDQLATVTGSTPSSVLTEIVLDDQPNAMIEVEPDEETGSYVITDLWFRDEEPESTEEDAEAQIQSSEILGRFMKSFNGLGQRVQVVDADSFFAASADSSDGKTVDYDELIAQAPVEDDEE